MIYPVKIKKITSPFGKRTLKGFKPSFHKGVDFSGSNESALAPCDLLIDSILIPDNEYPCLFEFDETKGIFVRIKNVPIGRAWTPYVIARPIDLKYEGIQFIFKHVNPVVTEKEVVKEGEPVGLIGNYGYSMGKHLHFEIIKDGKFIDPVKWLDSEI